MKLRRKIALLFTSISLFSLRVGESINANDNFNIRNIGSEYVGDIINGKRTGKGTLTYINGDKYVGEFVDYKKEGKGIFTWANGDSYCGQWENDVYHGKGILKKDGIIKDGYWDKGEFMGN